MRDSIFFVSFHQQDHEHGAASCAHGAYVGNMIMTCDAYAVSDWVTPTGTKRGPTDSRCIFERFSSFACVCGLDVTSLWLKRLSAVRKIEPRPNPDYHHNDRHNCSSNPPRRQNSGCFTHVDQKPTDVLVGQGIEPHPGPTTALEDYCPAGVIDQHASSTHLGCHNDTANTTQHNTTPHTHRRH